MEDVNSRTKLKKFYPIIKMTTFKDFEAYLKVRDYMVGNDLTFEDILKDFDDRIITISVSCDEVTKKFYSLASAANYMGVSLATVKYAYSNKRDTIRKMKGRTKVFHVYCLTKISIRAKRSISRVFSLFIVLSPFFVHCPYKGRINRAESVLTGLKPY